MKLINTLELIIVLITGITLNFSVYASSIDELKAEKEKLELESAIEKAKSEIAAAKKATAEAKRDEILSQIPATKTEALPGSVDIKNFGSAGLIVAVDLANQIAKPLCDSISINDKSVIVFDASTISGIVSANLLNDQISTLQGKLDEASKENKNDNPASMLPVAGVVAATETIKAVADLASMFKTNTTVDKTDFPESKAVLIAAMTNQCPQKISSIGVGYQGELDTSDFKDLRDRISTLMEDRIKLEEKNSKIKSQIKLEKNTTKKTELQLKINSYTATGKLVDDFITAIKPNELNDKSPLPILAKYLSLSRRTVNSNIMDLNIKLEGLSIIKENIFTGQKLYLSATGIVWYSIQDRSGNFIKGGVIRKIAQPVSLKLKGKEVSAAFFSN